MNHNQIEMFSNLIHSIEILQEFHEPPESIFHQFNSWISAVSSAMKIGGFNEEYQTWKEHLKYVSFTEDESSLPTQMSSLKAILLGFAGKYELEIGTDFIDPIRIEELSKLNSINFDFSKLLEMCREINICYSTGSYLAVAMITRAILDHVSPLFGYQSFKEVANNYVGSGKSYKETIATLENTSRKIADQYLHGHIRATESLPTKIQVDFRPALDLLLGEIVRITK
jgi:hypothetical protein